MMMRRELWPGYSTYTIWQTLLGTTRKLGHDHAVLAELYSTHMSNRLTELVDDLQRVYKKVPFLFSMLSVVIISSYFMAYIFDRYIGRNDWLLSTLQFKFPIEDMNTKKCYFSYLFLG